MLLWAPWAVLAALAGAGVLLQLDSVLEVVSLAVLAAAAVLLGRGFGESGRSALEDEIDGRSHELRRALSELEVAQTETVRRLSMAVEFRDEDTGAHIERIGRPVDAAGRADRDGPRVLRAPAPRGSVA